jgi:uncharacterized FAD-dependent dehydrogenase
MIREFALMLSPREAFDREALHARVARELSVGVERLEAVQLLKRSIDARSRQVKVAVVVRAFVDEPAPRAMHRIDYHDVRRADPVLVVGAGPAGLFAALRLIELGRRPIVLERGKPVQARRRDVAAIHQAHVVDPDSNYCFGEGGAGTFSDGKLYTRSTKRGDARRVLETFVAHGADEAILADAHPHIGTNKLPKIIVAMRESILAAGGEVHFETRVTDLVLAQGRVAAVLAATPTGPREFTAAHVILATGHSARDVFALLYRHGITLEVKGFAMGVRVEHPQELIDAAQYHGVRGQLADLRRYLPPAAYSFVHQASGRGVYSFCMCPGGVIAPCATAPGEIVTNGWSPSKRNNLYANSGVVVSIEPSDLGRYAEHGVMAGIRYQEDLERMAWRAGGQTQTAPAQALGDFVEGRASTKLPSCSYSPGVVAAPLHELLPPALHERLQEGLRAFGQKMRGYATNEAIVVGVESRTSSPIRVPRDAERRHHPGVVNLYPCGEGAGYAGGIVSAALDGQRTAEVIAAITER